MVVNGQTRELSLGPDFKKPIDHQAIDFAKTKIGPGFSFGTLAVQNVKVIAASGNPS